MTLIEWLDKLDKITFIIIYRDADSLFLDKVLPVFRNPLTWIPLYGFLLFFILTRFREKAWLFIILSILTVTIGDRLSVALFKPLFARPRPCFDPELRLVIRNIIECGGRFSFPSSHAVNHVGLASFWYWSIKNLTGKRYYWLWLWAVIIGYAQIYVGKHYPLDIAGGSLLGLIIGGSLAMVFTRWPRWMKPLAKTFSTIRPFKAKKTSV